jgi:hypothetical protein
MATDFAKTKAQDDRRNLTKLKAHADESTKKQNTVEQNNFQRLLNKMDTDKKLVTGDISKEQRVWVHKLDRLESEKRVIEQERRNSYIDMLMVALDDQETQGQKNKVTSTENKNENNFVSPFVSPVTEMLRRSSLPKDSSAPLGLRRSSSNVSDFRRSGPMIPSDPKLFLSRRGSLDASSIKQFVNHTIQTPGRRRSSTLSVSNPPASTPYVNRRRGSLPIRPMTVDSSVQHYSFGKDSAPGNNPCLAQLFPALDLDIRKQEESVRFKDIQKRVALFLSKPTSPPAEKIIPADDKQEKRKKKKSKGKKDLFPDDNRALPDLVTNCRRPRQRVKFDLPDDEPSDSDPGIERRIRAIGMERRRMSTPFELVDS